MSDSRSTTTDGRGLAFGRALPGWPEQPPRSPVLGLLPGEGAGPEVVAAARDVLEAVASSARVEIDIRTGGNIGLPARRAGGLDLPREIIAFCDEIFSSGGAILHGAGGGRFVYDLRAEFDLFCKIAPLQPMEALAGIGPLRARATADVDILIVRENVAGIYFDQNRDDNSDGNRHESRAGASDDSRNDDCPGQLRAVEQRFRYDAPQIDRVLQVAGKLASQRRGRVCLIVKRWGVPAVSRLWLERAEEIIGPSKLAFETLEIDNACYQIVADAARFDVIVAPNMFGDVIADVGALLLGSRGMSYSANFGTGGRAVYQTGHGAAYDLAGTDRANPIGQIQALALLLDESFRMPALRAAIEAALRGVLSSDIRTPEIAGPNSRVVGTREMGRRIAELAVRELRSAA